MNGQQLQLYDIYGMYHCPFWQTTIFYWVVALAFIALFLTGLFLFIKNRRARRLNKTPWQVALDELKALERRQVFDQQTAQEFYLTLTATMKRYFQDRYGYQVVGKTDSELLALLPTTSFPKELIPGIESLFRGSVEVKFAQGLALATQVKQDLTHAALVVQATVPRDR